MELITKLEEKKCPKSFGLEIACKTRINEKIVLFFIEIYANLPEK